MSSLAGCGTPIVRDRRVCRPRRAQNSCGTSIVTEVEAAIEKLTLAQQRETADWLNSRLIEGRRRCLPRSMRASVRWMRSRMSQSRSSPKDHAMSYRVILAAPATDAGSVLLELQDVLRSEIRLVLLRDTPMRDGAKGGDNPLPSARKF
jgi:hypothetical protein